MSSDHSLKYCKSETIFFKEAIHRDEQIRLAGYEEDEGFEPLDLK